MNKTERFHDNPNSLITDRLLNLSWLPKDSYQDLGRWMDWNELTQYVQTMNSVYPGGYSDYRIPSGEEMKKFCDFHLTNTDFEGETVHIHSVFVEKCSYWIWTSDVNEDDKALRINLRDGVMEYVDKASRDRHATRLCRNIKP